MSLEKSSVLAIIVVNVWAPFQMNILILVSIQLSSIASTQKLTTPSLSYLYSIGNEEAATARLAIADECLDDMINWLQVGGGQVGIYDGNNVTEDRRRVIRDRLLAQDIHVSSIHSTLLCMCYVCTIISQTHLIIYFSHFL